ncbi:MAG TPA: flagellar basal body protein [Steroidobacteraceae bacterium]|jgi:flagellar basal-body rod protein FlgB|nr:flagellar basal body protein [Steroidobacteraceae bacterium]
MRTSLDNYLGVHAQALTIEAKRNDVLAANLANVDTPGYKARDIDFKAALSAAGSGTAGGTTTNTIGTSGSNGTATQLALKHGNASAAAATAATASDADTTGVDASALRYRVPMAPALDGNTVDEQLEQSAFAENGVRYQASLTFLNNALRNLMTAITGS